MPRSWTIEICDDGTSWEMIHSVSDSVTLKSAAMIQSYSISLPKKSRFLRFNAPGGNHQNDNECHLKAFELFGILNE
jgi:hypothetical protein